SDRALPVIAVPTTCGTGSEGNGFAVLTNPDTKDKKSLRSPVIVPKASLIDPELMMTMPRGLTATVGFDALCHNMEAYLASARQPLTDMMALYGISLLAKSLCAVCGDAPDVSAWEDVTLASTLGGMVINTAGVGAPHSMEHPVSGLYDAVHGLGLAALMPVIVERSWQSAPDRYAGISRLLGGSGAADCADAIRALLRRLDIAVTLSQLGAREADIDWLADNCMKVSAAGMRNHPRQFSVDEIKDLYRLSL
ncbi:MAG: iron-containing alcohol dehydrogenase, partial [Acetanaerobacterium sp.]